MFVKTDMKMPIFVSNLVLFWKISNLFNPSTCAGPAIGFCLLFPTVSPEQNLQLI